MFARRAAGAFLTCSRAAASARSARSSARLARSIRHGGGPLTCFPRAAAASFAARAACIVFTRSDAAA